MKRILPFLLLVLLLFTCALAAPQDVLVVGIPRGAALDALAKEGLVPEARDGGSYYQLKRDDLFLEFSIEPTTDTIETVYWNVEGEGLYDHDLTAPDWQSLRYADVFAELTEKGIGYSLFRYEEVISLHVQARGYGGIAALSLYFLENGELQQTEFAPDEESGIYWAARFAAVLGAPVGEVAEFTDNEAGYATVHTVLEWETPTTGYLFEHADIIYDDREGGLFAPIIERRNSMLAFPMTGSGENNDPDDGHGHD